MNLMFKYTLQLLLISVICIFSSCLYSMPNVATTGYVPVSDHNLYYEKFGIQSEHPIIVLHGGPGLDGSYLLPQMIQLANCGEVIFYDQRGSGKSLGFALDKQTINMDNFVKDLELIRNHFGSKKIILVGHSWGGLLAMRYATLHQENIAALILVSSAPSTSGGFKLFIDEYSKRIQTIKSAVDKIETSDKFKQGDPTIVAEYFRLIFSKYFYRKYDLNKLTLNFTKESALSGRTVGEIIGETYLNNFDLTKDLNGLEMPVLIVHGRNDIVPLETANQTKIAIPGAQIVVLDECDHFPYIEKPNEFFKVMNEFITLNNK